MHMKSDEIDFLSGVFHAEKCPAFSMQKSQGICSISFPLEENGRGPGVTPTPKVMAAERSPRAAPMSTTEPFI
jgi:hypothetical protein